jgi:hypothetical protein
MENNDVSKVNSDFTSDMKLGFCFFQAQNDNPFQNFLKKIEVDDSTNKLTLTFSKFANKPIVIDFNNQKMKLPSNTEKAFNKFISVTYEYIADKKSVVLKTFRFDKGKLYKGIKSFDFNDLTHVKLTNFLNIYYDNYLKASRKITENDTNYVYPVPDFYKICLKGN